MEQREHRQQEMLVVRPMEEDVAKRWAPQLRNPSVHENLGQATSPCALLDRALFRVTEHDSAISPLRHARDRCIDNVERLPRKTPVEVDHDQARLQNSEIVRLEHIEIKALGVDLEEVDGADT